VSWTLFLGDLAWTESHYLNLLLSWITCWGYHALDVCLWSRRTKILQGIQCFWRHAKGSDLLADEESSNNEIFGSIFLPLKVTWENFFFFENQNQNPNENASIFTATTRNKVSLLNSKIDSFVEDCDLKSSNTLLINEIN